MDFTNSLFNNPLTISAADLYEQHQPRFPLAISFDDPPAPHVTLDDQSKFLAWITAMKQANPTVYYQYLEKYARSKEQLNALDRYYRARLEEILFTETLSTDQDMKYIRVLCTTFRKQEEKFFDIFQRDLEKVSSLVPEVRSLIIKKKAS